MRRLSLIPFTIALLAFGLLISCDSSGSTSSDGGGNPNQESVSDPIFSPRGDTFAVAQSVTLSSATSGATIYYTADGTTPTTSSTQYTGAITVGATETVQAIAVLNDSSSAVSSATYFIKSSSPTVSAPTFSPAGGTYTAAQSVTIASTTSGATIYYTADGTTPTTSSTQYTGAITVGATETVQAIAVNGGTRSTVASAAYTINIVTITPIPWNTSIDYGTLTDTRDGKVYKTVTIGTQTWMAENLNYKVGKSWCYAKNVDSCTKYGRLYQWAAAMGDTSSTIEGMWSDTVAIYNSNLLNATLPRQGICPSGWHVPSDMEWRKLTDTILISAKDTTFWHSSTAGTVLKSTGGWLNYNTGTDVYGFRVLPGGYCVSGVVSSSAGMDAYFWSSSEQSASYAWYWNFDDGYNNVHRNSDVFGKHYGLSVRCLQN